MAVTFRVMCWNIAEGSDDQRAPHNSQLLAIAEQIMAVAPDIVLLNEVKNWDGISGFFGNYVKQVEALAASTGIPHYRWANTVATGLTGHKAVAIMSRFPLSAPVYHPIMRGTSPTTYGTIECTLTVDGLLHHVFSTRFDSHHEADKVAAHLQSIDLIRGVMGTRPILFGGDFNASKANDQSFRDFLANSGLVHSYSANPGPSPCIQDENPDNIVDHLFFRGSYGVVQTQLRCPWAVPGVQEVSDHPWLLVELLSPPSGFYVKYGSVIKLKHLVTGGLLHSHPFNYGHSTGSGQQQVTAFASYDDNDQWRIKGPHGQPDDYRTGQWVGQGEIIRLEHLPTRKNLHSHLGPRSPVTGQQEVSAYGVFGAGDTNDDWRVELDSGTTWTSGRILRLIHVATNRALHSHRGFSHPQWTMGQQEVTGFAGRDDNDWWSLFQIRP